MAWLRTGDNVADHPIVLSVLEHEAADERHINEVFGFVMRCALRSASHFTDYVISYGTALSVAGSKPRAEELLELAVFAGYFTPAETDDGKLAFRLIEDVEFIHIRSREEIEFEKQRQSDRKDPSLTVPVWLRDGDACRYCRRIVNWRDQKSGKSGTFDHLVPNAPATHDTYVVCCRRCNGKLGQMPFEERQEFLLPAPPEPHFSREGVKHWGNHKWVEENNVVLPKPTVTQKLKPGDFLPGETKISKLIQSLRKDGQDGGTQPPTNTADSSGPLGPDTHQVPVDPAEQTASRGPQGTADTASVRPAREAPGDGPQGMAGSAPVRPASPSNRDEAQEDGTQPPPHDAESHSRPLSDTEKQARPPAETPTRQISEQYSAIRSGRGGEISGYPGRDGSGRAGTARDGAGRGGSGRERARSALPSSPPSNRKRRRRR